MDKKDDRALPLKESHPEIAQRANGWDSSLIDLNPADLRNWTCPNGHQKLASITTYISSSNPCLGCNDENRSVADYSPSAAAIASGWDPLRMLSSSKEELEWECSKGHSWIATVSKQLAYGSKCSACAPPSRPLDLLEDFPDLAHQANGWNPHDRNQKISMKMEWICASGHQWSATLNNRILRSSGCPYCAGKKAIVGENDLATLHPALAKEAHGWDPTTVMSSTGRKLDWKASCGHVWDALLADRIKRGNGCPFCSGKRVLVGFNDLKTTHPDLASEAEGWDPSTLSFGSGEIRDWRGSCGHVWPATVNHRVHGRGCSLCAGKRAVSGINDLASANPSLAAEAYGWDPKTFTVGSAKNLEWKGVCGHIWKASIKFRMKGKGCPYCTGKRVLTGFNDLATTHPELAKQAHNWDPSTLTAGSGKIREWLGLCGHTWSTKVDFRKRGSGCPSCTTKGFNNAKPAWLYVLVGHLQGRVVVQFGITANPKKRLNVHRLIGFTSEPLGLIYFPDGGDARAEENRIMKLQAERKVPKATASGVYFSGSSESFLWTARSAKGFAELLCEELNMDKQVLYQQVAEHTRDVLTPPPERNRGKRNPVGAWEESLPPEDS